jgi:hypothetical protein
MTGDAGQTGTAELRACLQVIKSAGGLAPNGEPEKSLVPLTLAWLLDIGGGAYVFNFCCCLFCV